MNKILLGLLIISTLALSCKKDDDNGGGGGNAGGTYLNTTAGNVWNYETTSGGGAPETYSLTATDSTEFKSSGRQYKVFRRSTGEKEFYAVSGNEYYKWENLGLPGSEYENKYLVDNFPFGEFWTAGTVLIDIDTTQLSLNASIRFKRKILNSNTSITVNNRNYSNVIHVTSVPEVVALNISFNGIGISGASLDLSTSEFATYFAPKYGIISDSARLGGTLTIPAIPPILTNPITVPLDNLIDNQTRLMSASF